MTKHNIALNDIYVLTGQSIRKKNPAAIRRSLADVFGIISNQELANVKKEDRWFFSQSLKSIRPTVQSSYAEWSGVLVIDLDVKNAKSALVVKQYLSKLLSKQPWLAGIVLSTSHKGVHVYTACKPDIAIFDKEAYLDHAESMSIYVWQALIIAYKLASSAKELDNTDLLDMHPELNISSRKTTQSGELSESRMFDLATFKLTQPTLLGYDPEPFINDNFSLEPPLGFTEQAYEGLADIAFLKNMFDKKRGRLHEQAVSIEVSNADLPTVEQCMPRSYDNTARYRLAYTLANLYDITSNGHPHYKLLMDCFLRMCSGNPKFKQEKRAFAAVFDSAVQRQMTGMCPRIAWAINELRTVHKFNITVENEEQILHQILDVDIDLELSKPIAIPPELQIQYDAIYDLQTGQYIANATGILMSRLNKPSQKTLLIAEPGTGKTVFATNLMQSTKLRVLCVVPYISVIESKFKTLPPEANCQCCYGFTSYDVTLSRNAVMTFDKFSRMSMTDLDLCFDIIILDESHLLQMSAYRSLVPAECVDRLRNTKTPTVLMTGTPIAEHMFIDFTTKVLFRRNRATDKLFSLIVCNNPAEKFAQACRHICNAIRHGRKVIMPTNEGNSYAEKVVAAVNSMLKRMPNWQYYKKEFADQGFMFEVNRNQTIGDIELLFCSSYLSVGVDINDFDSFDIVYTEDFSAHEIEQFNNRLRRVDLASYYFIAKYQATGGVQPNCFATLTPNLRVSKVRQLELHDLLALQTIKADKNGQISVLFDYFAKHMRMPWLLRQPNGDVQLHATCYSLWTFEDTWRKWSHQVPVLVWQLRQYNYQINVINTELLDNDELGDILDAARAGLHDYKHRIEADLMFIVELMQHKDFYDVMVYSNAIKLVRRKFQCLEVFEDYAYLSVQNVAQCYRFIRSCRMLAKYYTRQTVLKLFDDVNNALSKFEHVCSTVELLDMAANDRLSSANVTAMQYVLDVMFDKQKRTMMSKLQYLTHLNKITDLYKELYDLSAVSILEKIRCHADSMVKKLATKLTGHQGDTVANLWELKTIPAFDSSAQLNLAAQKELMYSMFKASIFEVNEDKKSSEAAKQFFAAPKDRESDNVDLVQSMQNLKSLEVKPTLSNADKSTMKQYLQQWYPDMTLRDIKQAIDKVDIYSDVSYMLQLDKIIKTDNI